MIDSVQSGAQQAVSLSALKQQAQAEQKVAETVAQSTDQLQRTVEAQANPPRGQRVDTEA